MWKCIGARVAWVTFRPASLCKFDTNVLRVGAGTRLAPLLPVAALSVTRSRYGNRKEHKVVQICAQPMCRMLTVYRIV